MRESLDQLAFVWAAYGVGGIATLALVSWSWLAMLRAERLRDKARGR